MISILNYYSKTRVRTKAILFNKSEDKLLFQCRKIAFKIFPRASMCSGTLRPQSQCSEDMLVYYLRGG